MRNDAPRVCIIGAGASGLALAYALSLRRINTLICDAGKAGQGALAASAGMIAPGAEVWEARERAHPLTNAFAGLARHSAVLWPEWAARLAADTGIDPGYRPCGALIPVPEGTDIQDMAAQMALIGIKAEPVGPAGAAARMHGLDVRAGACFLPGDAQVNAPDLARALLAALGASDYVEIRENARVTGLEPAGERQHVRLADGQVIEADYAVLAAGWAAAGLHPAASGVFPVQGQALMLQADSALASDHWPLLRAGDVYLAAKAGGRILVGASAEPGRSDTLTDPATAERLMARAARHLPAIAGMKRLGHWAGVRPALLGMMPRAGLAAPGLVVALGAYRHGVMLAPAMAEGLARLIDEGRAGSPLAPFAPGTVNEGLSSAG